MDVEKLLGGMASNDLDKLAQEALGGTSPEMKKKLEKFIQDSKNPGERSLDQILECLSTGADLVKGLIDDAKSKSTDVRNQTEC